MLTTSAQGQEQTRNTSDLSVHLYQSNGSPPEKREMIQGIMKISTAKVKTTGVYQRVMRRSMVSVGDFEAWAFSIMLKILLMEESENLRTVRTLTALSTGMIPEGSSSPGLNVPGTDSPVMADVSNSAGVLPRRVESTGTRSPGRTRSRESSGSSEGDTVRSLSSSITVAVSGSRPKSLRIRDLTSSDAFPSSFSPMQ